MEQFSIGEGAFNNCDSLTSITIPGSVINIGRRAFGYSGSDILDECEKLAGFTIYGVKNSAAERYADINGFKFVAIAGDSSMTEKTNTEETTTKAPETTTKAPEITTKAPEPTTQVPTTQEPSTDLEIKNELDIKPGSDIISAEGDMATVPAGQSVDTVKAELANENVKITDKNGKELTGDALLGTGAKIQLLDKDGNVLSEYTVLVPMDINGDGKITAADARSALRASAQLNNLGVVFSMAADTNGDNKITAADARKILRVSAQIETA